MNVKKTIKKEIAETAEVLPQVIVKEVSKTKSLSLPLLLLLVVTTSLALYFGYKLNRVASTAEQISQKQISELVAKVGELIILPPDETPTLATVTDLDKLKGQPFFAHAKLGDKVLIYVKAGKAILYNPELHKIVDVSPLVPGSSNIKPAEASAVKPAVKK